MECRGHKNYHLGFRGTGLGTQPQIEMENDMRKDWEAGFW